MSAIGGPADPVFVLITPAHNEAAHIERVVAAVAAQTRVPDRWIVVNDSSTDATGEILERCRREVPFLEVVHSPPRQAGDRLAAALEARAFNHALENHVSLSYTHLGKLDADIVIPPEWFETLLGRFTARTGILGGRITESGELIAAAPNHVHGAVKLYSADCFAAIGGMQERLGWDHADETYARMSGFETHAFPDLVAEHLRAVGSAQGRLRGRARHGECAYIGQQPLWWAGLRAARMGATSSPRLLSGLSFMYGYARAAAKRAPRSGGREYRAFTRRELRTRVLRVGRPPTALPEGDVE